MSKTSQSDPLLTVSDSVMTLLPTGSLITGNDLDNLLTGTVGDDTILGLGGNDQLHGQAGADTVLAEAGNDSLYGGSGNDRLDGGSGNDLLDGGVGNNVYLFGRADGQDRIVATWDNVSSKLNTLQFKDGVASTDVLLKQLELWAPNLSWHRGLEVSIVGTTDKLTIEGVFDQDNPNNAYNPIQQFRFADGSSWNLAAILANLYSGTSGVDNLAGTVWDDQLSGGLGADVLGGRAGNDALSGGADNDSLYGESGNDSLDGGSGNDSLDGGSGNDLLDGGLGNNVYLFGRADGQDRIVSYWDNTAARLNTIQFKDGVNSTDILLKQIDLWLPSIGSHRALEVSIAGTTDKLTI